MTKGNQRGLSRREVIVGGVTAAVVASCDVPHIDDGLVPVAYWQEDEDMTAPLPPNLTQPLVMWASIVAPPNSDSPVPNELLMNPYGLPMEILEVRFRVYPITPSGTNFPTLNGMGLGVKMDLGKAQVVDAGVPVSLLGNVRDSYEGQAKVYGNPDDGTVFAYPTTYSWRLKYPLFVPAGGVLACVFTPMGQNVYPVNVDVAYIARTWDMTRPQPAKTKVPWVASYQSKVFDYETGAAAAFDVSPTLDMLNPFGVPLELQRLTGRASLTQSTAGAGATGQFSGVTNSIVEDVTEFHTTYSQLRLRSSRGFDLIRTPAPFGGFFPANWRAWDVPEKWFMAPQEFYRAQLSVSAISGTVSYLARAQFAMGMVGYREVDVASLEGA